MLLRLRLVSFLCVVLLIILSHPSTVLAQEQNCQQELSQANNRYTMGRFDETITLIDACLEKTGITEAERRMAFRLKGLSYIGKGLELDARTSVRRLIELVPDYQPDPDQDPPDFVEMVNELKEEINQALAERQEAADPEPEPESEQVEVDVKDEPIVSAQPPQQPRKKKKNGGKIALIGGGIAAAGVAVLLLAGGGGDGDGGGVGVVIGEPPPLPN